LIIAGVKEGDVKSVTKCCRTIIEITIERADELNLIDLEDEQYATIKKNIEKSEEESEEESDDESVRSDVHAAKGRQRDPTPRSCFRGGRVLQKKVAPSRRARRLLRSRLL
jgi:predicted metal-binding transcription factor (methanogenesis marker protein 9)